MVGAGKEMLTRRVSQLKKCLCYDNFSAEVFQSISGTRPLVLDSFSLVPTEIFL
jgi:hypothetical protein